MDVCANEQYLVYSTLSPIVRLLDLETLCKKQEQINFNQSDNDDYHYFGGQAIMSLKLSGDTREILAGTKGAAILVYDLISNRVINRVQTTHSDEINSVCFANRADSHIVFTGSDDSTVQVWDRRALGSGTQGRAMGMFLGHTEGITNVTSKGDGVYLASNGKDQLLKIWDMRKMIP
mmetsp:Transcript_7060/g.5311  ORF Transcript_7060/g.5311 Transcript_7060/m.5311 type:complete len:177 (+) Transcript_7060:631-1161(+)|eukprot:CAMPEP_0202971978 /NCGR_PEP_ID=MMETSP1396-20130829/32198_1 /ASSEMBLY_ACC=CAM_ASM_000872 /TAXON_ID= /ORGANISM="Pseudokeronopsis sp., Strain Brazil" /LENGTH=176 /DNA_ID=CAMNT_0049701917 /DNA_START=631 /DNA_END=1161 /DNA_ORIENTATION=-